jgi:hypothetical protein
VCDTLRLHEGALSALRRATPPSRNGLSHANRTRSLCAALKAGEIAFFNKAYVDFKHLSELTRRGVLWVTRPPT